MCMKINLADYLWNSNQRLCMKINHVDYLWNGNRRMCWKLIMPITFEKVTDEYAWKINLADFKILTGEYAWK